MLSIKSKIFTAAAAALAFGAASPAAHATASVGAIYACYACQNTGDATIDAALAANPSVASDGLLFAFANTTGSAIGNAVFHVSTGSYTDSFALGTLAANATAIFMPGLSSDGGSHGATSLFRYTGSTMDTSDGDGAVNDATKFWFTGTQGANAVTSAVVTPGDVILPWRAPTGGSVSFVGFGPSGDPGCTNCYFGKIGTLSAAPEPEAWALMLTGLIVTGASLRRREPLRAPARIA